MPAPKLHTTNYYNTFIEVAEDSKAAEGNKPAVKGTQKTVAEIQYALIAGHPYTHTSDEVLFKVYAQRNDFAKAEYEKARTAFFSKGQPCFRASPLTKTYGYGIHFNEEGKMALYGVETPEYQAFLADTEVKKVKAMRSGKK